MRRFRNIRFITLLLMLLCWGNSLTQNDTLKGIEKLRVLVDEGKVNEAKTELASQIEFFKSQKNYDTLTSYIEFVGSYALSGNDRDKALKSAIDFVDELKSLDNPEISVSALKELAWIYDEAGEPRRAYELIKEAVELYKNDYELSYKVENLYYNMGYYALAMGDFPLSKKNYFISLNILSERTEPDYVFYQQIYNSLGGIYWRQGMLDSSQYYFNKSVEVLTKAESNPQNNYYRPALTKMNMAVIAHSLGRSQNSIQLSEEAISGFQKFINISLDEQKKDAAKRNQLAAIDNLGVFYNGIGEFTRAEEIITYSYQEKQKMLTPDDPAVLISKVILAQSKLNTRDLDGAGALLDDLFSKIEGNDNFQFYWHAAALSARATVYNQQENPSKAEEFYREGEELYRQSLGGAYTEAFLSEIGIMSQFYAENRQEEKAVRMAMESFNATSEGDFKNTLQQYLSILNLAEVNFLLEDYSESKRISEEALSFNLGLLDGTTRSSDSIALQFKKPRAVLIHAKSSYELAQQKNTVLLESLLLELNEAFEILEQRKTIIKNHEDLTLLLNENDDLINFSKQLNLELYNNTKKNEYLLNVINLHESAIYSRIRSRLNLHQTMSFTGVPAEIADRENELKAEISKSLDQGDLGMKPFFEANKKWEVFLDSLKSDYPKYYRMRYASLENPIDDLSSLASGDKSIIRYLFIDDSLYAFVMSKGELKVYPLDFSEVKTAIENWDNNSFELTDFAPQLNQLYRTLWQPFESDLNTSRVIIIPDRELFNVSFEMLTSGVANTFEELAEKSLLSKFEISYNFSLLLTDTQENTSLFDDNFIAFAPEFSDAMKDEYQMSITDSIDLDQTYLTLLPQPFTKKVVFDYSRLFNGEAFMNKKASKELFTREVGEHKIIHIGTHAEANNVSPELSRLIFAKNISDSINLNENSLYTYEIYNYDLASNLAVLTACETGKPTYQPGEGMISLAHAFTYAGSESILTSLWKIDEQSSAKIIEYFYENLQNGDRKDKALQKAKLSYLRTAKGRARTPQYWAGLVLMGDTEPLEIKSGFPYKWLFLILGILVVGFLIYKKRIAS